MKNYELTIENGVITWVKDTDVNGNLMNGGMRGVAFVEAATQAEASWAFKQQYAGQFSTIERIEKFC